MRGSEVGATDEVDTGSGADVEGVGWVGAESEVFVSGGGRGEIVVDGSGGTDVIVDGGGRSGVIIDCGSRSGIVIDVGGQVEDVVPDGSRGDVVDGGNWLFGHGDRLRMAPVVSSGMLRFRIELVRGKR